MPKHLTVNDVADFVTAEQVGAEGGVAQLGSDGKVPNDQLPATSTGSVDSVNGHVGNVVLTADDVSAIATTAKGQANGVPQLDSTGRIPPTQLPTTALLSSSLGVANGIAQLDGTGKIPTGQVPAAPVTSVNGHTGVVALSASDVSALPTSQKGAASGLATLDANSKVPVAQIPSLVGSYQQAPSTTPTKPGEVLTAIAGGSNSAQWTEPLVYTASSAGAMPAGIPNGSLCTRTDLRAVYEYISGSWVALPYIEPWRTITLNTGVRGYTNNDPNWLPQLRRVGNQVFVRGRAELTSGNNFANAFVIFNIPSDCIPLRIQEIIGASTTSSNQIGTCRFQVNDASDSTNPGQFIFFAGSGPNPNTPWVGLAGSYWLD